MSKEAFDAYMELEKKHIAMMKAMENTDNLDFNTISEKMSVLYRVMTKMEQMKVGIRSAVIQKGELKIDADFLRKNPDCIFVFGDNLQGKGKGGAAILRDEPNTYGFVTKKVPNNNPSSFYTVKEYTPRFVIELVKLRSAIKSNPTKLYLISKLGAGLANRFRIWEGVIKDGIEDIRQFDNVEFLFT